MNKTEMVKGTETINEVKDTDATALVVMLTARELLALCVMSEKTAIGAAGLHRVLSGPCLNGIDKTDAHAMLVDLHKRGLVRRATNNQYELSQAMRDHMPKALTVTVPLPEESRSLPRITAECHDDERVYEVPSFDCTAWFERASDGQIRDLIGIGFGGGQASEAVAEHYDGVIDAVTVMLAYKRRGFECHVDGDQAWAWIKVHRPYLDEEHKSGQNVIRGTGQ